MFDFRKLRVVDQARLVIRLTYGVTAAFPPGERYSLAQQMRRAAVAIGSNIAEGSGRSSNPALRVALDRAMAEASELEFQYVVCGDLSIGLRPAVEEALAETIRLKKMLAKLIVAVRKRQPDDEGRHGSSAHPDVSTS